MVIKVASIIVSMMNKAGGSAAYGEWASKHIKSRRGASLATFALGSLIFVDDYFNCLTVGSVMRPVTDKQRISRAKLAYLIDATAAAVSFVSFLLAGIVKNWFVVFPVSIVLLVGTLYVIKLIGKKREEAAK